MRADERIIYSETQGDVTDALHYLREAVGKLDHEFEEERRANNESMETIDKLKQQLNELQCEYEMLRKADWEYECLWTWLDENTDLLNTIEPLMEGWKKEMIE
jgi:hypothetical protein